MQSSDPDTVSAEYAGHKRPAEAASGEQPSKRRAARACLSCRNRKVRCDVVTGGHPCTNCRLDSIRCVVKQSNRGRKPGATTTSSAQYRPRSQPSNECRDRPASPVDASGGLGTPSPRLPRPITLNGNLSAVSLNERRSQSPYEIGADRVSPLSAHQSHVEHRRDPLPGDYSNPPLMRAATPASLRGVANPDPTGPCLPPYIRPLPRHITPRDIGYLADKDALTIPDDVLRDEALRAYVTFVHPFMPTVDLEDFLLPIIHGDGRGSVSFVLFQAVMFASISYVCPKLLRSRGYSSKKEARKAFFGRVRLLYALECEQEHLPLLQAVLLMTYWYDCPDDGKEGWYWTGIALSLAQVVGIHRETELCRTTAKTKRLRRRLWWSCVIQDRLIAVGIRKPSRIRDDAFDVPQLTLDDFDLSDPSASLINFLGESGSVVSGVPARSALAVMCVELAKLAVCIGHIVHSQYSAVSDQPIIAEYMLRVIVFPKRSTTSQHELAQCDAELDQWINNQDPRAKYTPGPRKAVGNQGKADKIISLHQGLLYMNYLMSVSILHKPQVFYPEAEAAEEDDSTQKSASKRKVTDAAVAMTKLGFDMQMDDHLQYLSTSSIPAFISATLTHLADIRSHDEEVRNMSVGRFYQCMHVLQQLQNIYSSADYAVHFLAGIIRSIDFTVPSLLPGLASSRPDWSKPQLLGWNTTATEKEPATGLATAYPSPSSCQTNSFANAGPLDGIGNRRSETRNDHPRASQYSQFEPWPDPNHNFGFGNPTTATGSFAPDLSYMGTWLDLGGLVPGLINLDGDGSWTIPNNVAPAEDQDMRPCNLFSTL